MMGIASRRAIAVAARPNQQSANITRLQTMELGPQPESPPKKSRQSIGGQILTMVVFSILSGSHLEKPLLRYSMPRDPYRWIEDLILGIGFLVAVVAFAIRLRRQTTPASA